MTYDLGVSSPRHLESVDDFLDDVTRVDIVSTASGIHGGAV